MMLQVYFSIKSEEKFWETEVRSILLRMQNNQPTINQPTTNQPFNKPLENKSIGRSEL